MERIARSVEVWRNDDTNEIVISHPAFKTVENRIGQIAFSARHARHLAQVLIEFAADVDAQTCSGNGFTPRRKYSLKCRDDIASVDLRKTGMREVLNGAKGEASARANCEPAAEPAGFRTMNNHSSFSQKTA